MILFFVLSKPQNKLHVFLRWTDESGIVWVMLWHLQDCLLSHVWGGFAVKTDRSKVITESSFQCGLQRKNIFKLNVLSFPSLLGTQAYWRLTFRHKILTFINYAKCKEKTYLYVYIMVSGFFSIIVFFSVQPQKVKTYV